MKIFCMFAAYIRLIGNRPVSKTDSTPALVTVADKIKKGELNPLFSYLFSSFWIFARHWS